MLIQSQISIFVNGSRRLTRFRHSLETVHHGCEHGIATVTATFVRRTFLALQYKSLAICRLCQIVTPRSVECDGTLESPPV